MFTIVITGPESSGKTAMAEALAAALQCSWVPEFSRSYLERLERAYTYFDLLTIASGQWLWLRQAVSAEPDFLVADTDLQVMDIWHRVKYGDADPCITDWRRRWTPDLYILCAPDFPWSDDPLREHPEMREYLFERYEEDLKLKQLRYLIASGPPEQRLSSVLEALSLPGLAYPPAGSVK